MLLFTFAEYTKPEFCLFLYAYRRESLLHIRVKIEDDAFRRQGAEKTLGHKKRTGEWRKLYNGELHVLYSLPNIMEYETHIEEKETHTDLRFGKAKKQDHLEKTRK